ncbi:hypothetical protein, partial [Escherichia sp. E2586]|uniref:hypothetical protein n=1 Tax=Escherichia sp. E2586 TaxID=2044457 RepID=UPI003464D6DA
ITCLRTFAARGITATAGNDCPGAEPQKFFACFWAKSFAGCAFHPWTGGDGCGCLCPRRQGLKQVYGTGHNNGQGPAATTKSACAKRRCPLHPGGLLPGCRERRPRRDRGGATVPSLQARGFASGMEARQGGDSSAGSVHDSPPRQGDARKRHSQENNKTDSNQSNRKKKNSSRNNNIISNRQMTGMKKQKPPSERPRNERGGA